MTTKKPPATLQTAHGVLKFPAYVPVTTFGDRYPLDDLIRPYLPRLAPAIMVSLHYARQMKERPTLPMLIDSGGFASLFQNAECRRRSKSEPPCRSNTEPGAQASFLIAGCG